MDSGNSSPIQYILYSLFGLVWYIYVNSSHRLLSIYQEFGRGSISECNIRPLFLEIISIHGKSIWAVSHDNLQSSSGDEAFNPDGLVPRCIRLLKDKFPDLVSWHIKLIHQFIYFPFKEISLARQSELCWFGPLSNDCVLLLHYIWNAGFSVTCDFREVFVFDLECWINEVWFWV